MTRPRPTGRSSAPAPRAARRAPRSARTARGGILARPRAPAAQTLDGVRTELIFKLRDGEVKDDEREVSPAAARTKD